MPVLRRDDSFWESERTWCTLWPGGAGKAENPKVLPSGGQPPNPWRDILAGGGAFTRKGGCPWVPIHSDFIAGLQRKPLATTSWDQSRRSKQSVVTPGFCQINRGLELTSPWHWQFRLTPRAFPLWASVLTCTMMGTISTSQNWCEDQDMRKCVKNRAQGLASFTAGIQ